MALTPFTRIKTTVADINALQDVLARIFLSLLKIEIVDGRLIEGVKIEFGGTTINHKMGRKLKGWVVIDKNADESIWRINATTRPEQQLTLNASGTVTVSLWVF